MLCNLYNYYKEFIINNTGSDGNYTSDSNSDSTIIGDEPTLTEFDPVHEHPEEDQEIKATDNLDITVSFSDLIQLGQNLVVTLHNHYN